DRRDRRGGPADPPAAAAVARLRRRRGRAADPGQPHEFPDRQRRGHRADLRRRPRRRPRLPGAEDGLPRPRNHRPAVARHPVRRRLLPLHLPAGAPMSGEERVASGEVRHYGDLLVCQKALAWVRGVYQASAECPGDDRFALTNEVRRPAVSAPTVTAEASSRGSTAHFLRLLCIARGSLAEVETQLKTALSLDYLDQSQLAPLLAGADELSRMLAGLIATLEGRRT